MAHEPNRQIRRKEFTDDIIEQVREAVREELADAPESFRREDLEANRRKRVGSHSLGRGRSELRGNAI